MFIDYVLLETAAGVDVDFIDFPREKLWAIQKPAKMCDPDLEDITDLAFSLNLA